MFVSESGAAFDLRYQYRYEFSGSFILYEGIGMPTVKEGNAGWVIKKYVNDGTNVTKITFADGSLAFDKTWSNRSTYGY